MCNFRIPKSRKVEVTMVYLQLHLHFMQQWETIYQVCSLISWRWDITLWNALENKNLPHFWFLINKARYQRRSALRKLMFIAHVWCQTHMEIWFNAKTVTNGSISNVLIFSHFPTVMTNGHALLVCETEIFIQPFSFPSLDSEFIPSPPPPLPPPPPPPPPSPPPSIAFTFNTPEVNQNE